ncbi:MAG: VWA domain-containing protein [Akkermansiaceae bacterium]
MSFSQPAWLLLLLILPMILLGAILSHVKRGKTWRRLIAPRLRSRLIQETSNLRQWISLSLAIIGIALMIAAIARPFSGEVSVSEKIRSRNILVAVDTSRSMLVEDTSPNRLSAAKTIAIELLERFPNDRIGLIAFSGSAVLVAPLTIDHAAIHSSVSQLDTRIIPSGGSDISSVIDVAIKTHGRSNNQSNALIIISDGEDHSDKIDQASAEIRSSGITVCSIGVGKITGGIIPDPNSRDNKFRDIHGRTVHSSLIPSSLDQLARAGGGTYVSSEMGSSHAIETALSSLDFDSEEKRTVTIPNELYQWFLLAAIALLILSIIIRSQFSPTKIMKHQGKPIAAILITMLCLCQLAPAKSIIQQADDAYQAKDYSQASKLFLKALSDAEPEDTFALRLGLGSTAYHLKQWDNACRHFSHALKSTSPTLQPEAHYNLANALFQKAGAKLTDKNPDDSPEVKMRSVIEHLEDAISHYQSTLKLSPEHSSAAHNLKLAEEFLKKLQQQQQKQQEQQQKNQQNKENEDSQQQQKENQQGEPEQQDGENSPDQQQPDNKENDQQDGSGENPQDKEQQNPKQGESDDQDSSGNTQNQPDPNSQKPQDAKPSMERKEGETPEAHAARILRENSDAETRPVQRRRLFIRRSSKDW